MDKLNIPGTTNGIPFNWDDIEFFLGQGSYSAGVYSFLTSFFSYYGSDFIIVGCEASGGGTIIAEGYVFLNNEIIKVDAHTSTNTYYEKVTSYNADGNKQTQLSGTADIYQENRATATAASGTLTKTSTRFETILKNTLDVNRKIVNIGTWDMDTDIGKNVNHGLTFSTIRGARAYILNDAGTALAPLDIEVGSSVSITSTQLQMLRANGGLYDNTNYNGSSNRGYIVIDYSV